MFRLIRIVPIIGSRIKYAQQLEIKARARDFNGIRSRAEIMADMPVEVISQEDIFFSVPKGRLKLRVRRPNPAQLIYYERPDQNGPSVRIIRSLRLPTPIISSVVVACTWRSRACPQDPLPLPRRADTRPCR